jgi:hypothetical protein
MRPFRWPSRYGKPAILSSALGGCGLNHHVQVVVTAARILLFGNEI